MPYAVVSGFTGGTKTTYTAKGVVYDVYTFDNPAGGSITFSTAGHVDYLLVGGGGAGGSSPEFVGPRSGGGGAGGLLSGTALVATGAQTLTIGAGGLASTITTNANGGNGGDTVALGLTAIGGGGGGGGIDQMGSAGGSGGGAGISNAVNTTGTGTPGQGFGGGATNATNGPAGGGGGGAGGSGGSGATVGGVGGVGLVSDITGAPVGYAGGGGGGVSVGDAFGLGTSGGGNGGSEFQVPQPGTNGRGGGGGGAGAPTGFSPVDRAFGANGGNGVVIIRVAIDVVTAPRKLFIVAGQSNAVGRSNEDNGASFPPGVVEYRASDWEAVTSRIYHGTVEAANTTAANFGFDRQFAIDYLAANPADNIGFIGVAEGGTGFLPGDWNAGNPTYNRAVARINTALAAHPGAYEVAGILWHQGEADATAGEDYAANLRAFVAAFKTAIGLPNVPFVFGGHTNRSANYNPLVHAANQGMFNELVRGGYAAADIPKDATLQDSVHLDAVAIRDLGSQMFVGWNEAVANTALGGGGTITVGTPQVVTSSITNPSNAVAVPIGAEDANRMVLVGVAMRRSSSTCRPVSVTVGGLRATRMGDAIDTITGGNTTAWYYVKVPTGTSADISVLLTSIPTAAQASIVVVPVYNARPHLANARAFRNYQAGNAAGTAFTLNPEVKTGDLLLALFVAQTTAPAPVPTSNIGAVTYLAQTNITTAVATQIVAADGAPNVTVTWDKVVNNPSNTVIALRPVAGAVAVDGTGAGTLPRLTGAGAGGVGVSGTGAGTLARLTGAGAGAVAVSGTGAGTLPRITGAGAGGVAVSGAGAGTLSRLTGAGAGGVAVSGTGAGTLPRLTGAGTGEGVAIITGAGTGTLPAFVGAGTGAVAVSGTGTGTLPRLTGAGTGEGVAIITGTGAGTLPAFVGAGTGAGVAIITGTGAGIFPVFLGAGAGGVAVSGAGVAVLPALIGVGNSGLLSSRRFAYANQSRNYLTG